MTAFLDEIEGLINESTAWTVFKSHLPDSTIVSDKAIALIELPGEGETGRPDIDRRGLRVIVRGSAMSSSAGSYAATEAVAISIRDDLVGYSGDSTSTLSHHYVGIWSLSGPGFNGFDASWRPSFTSDYRCWRSQD